MSGAGQGRLGALSEPQFRLLWIGQTASAFGDALMPVAVAFAVLGIGGSAVDLGIVISAFTVGHLLLVLAGGVWADRLPRRRVMIACDLLRTVVEAALAVLLISGGAQVWQLAVGAFVIGGAGAFFVPAATGLVPETVSPGRLQQANALMGLSRSATGIFGPPAAGLLVALAGPGTAFAVDGATFILSAASLAALRVPSRPRPAEQGHFLTDLRDGWREVTSRRWLIASICTFAVTNMASSTFFILGPITAEAELGGAAAWGAILTGGAVGGLVGGLIAIRVHPGRPLLVGFLISTLMAGPLLTLSVPLAVPLIAVAAFGSWLAIQLGNTWWFTLLQQHVPEQALSRVSSYDWLVSLVFQPLGYMLAGPLAAGLGLTPTLVGAGVLLIAANLLVLGVRSVREVRWVEGAEPAA